MIPFNGKLLVIRSVIFTFIFLGLLFSTARSEEIVVATHYIPRLSFERQDGYRDGREIRVVREILTNLGYSENEIKFVPVNVNQKFNFVVDNNARLYIGAATINYDRQVMGDFTLPHLTTRYTVLIKRNELSWFRKLGRAIFQTVGWLFHPSFWIIVSAIVLFLVFKAFAVTSVERIEHPHNSETFRHAFGRILWWTVSTFCNFNIDSKDYVPVGKYARIVASVFTIFLVLVGINYIQEGMKDVLYQLPEEINVEYDLSGKHISTKAGTTSVDLAHQLGASVQTEVSLEKAIQTLENGEVDALLYDSITLNQYLKSREKKPSYSLVPVAELGTQNFAAFFREDDPMIEDWNRELEKIPPSLINEWNRMFLK